MNRRSHRLQAGLLGLVAAVLGPCLARAQEPTLLIWDANASQAGANDGSGTWRAADNEFPSWVPSPDSPTEENTIWPEGADGFNTIAVFGNGGSLALADRTVTVSGVVNTGGLIFRPLTLTSTTGDPPTTEVFYSYQFTGGTIQFAQGSVIEIDQNASSTDTRHRIILNSVLAGSDVTILKTPASTDVGLIQLGGNNTWTGTLNMEGSLFVDVRSINSLNSLGAINVKSGATLVINYGSGNLDVPLTLAGNGSASRGAIRFDQSRTISGTVTLADATGISANVAGTTGTITGNIGETGGSQLLRINTNSVAGTIELGGDNTFTGGVEIVAGTLRLTGAGALNSSAPNLVSFTANTAAKTLSLGGHSVSVGGLVSSGGTGTITVQNGGATAASLTIDNAAERTFAGVLADGGSGALTLIKEGAGRQILTGTASTYTGGTVINEGILRISGDRSLGAVPASFDADNISFNGGTLQFASAFNLDNNRGITLQAGGGTLDTQGFNTFYGGGISGDGPLSKRGTGVLVLNSASTYTGETRVLEGVVSVRHNQALGGTAGGTIVSNGARLDLRDGVTVTGESLITPVLSSGDGANVWAGDVRAAVGATLTLDVQSGSLLISGNVNAASTDGSAHTATLDGAGNGEISGVLSNTIVLNKNGAGTWKLSGNNTFTGGLNIGAGKIVLGHAGALNAAAPNTVTFANNASSKTLALEGTSAVAAGLNSSGGAGAVTTENGAAADAVLTLAGAGTYAYGGILRDGAGGGKLGLTKTGTGTQTLSGANTYTGNTTVQAGTLRLDFGATGAPVSNIIGSGSTLVLGGGTLSVTGSSTAATSQTFNGLTVAAGISTLSVSAGATPQGVVVNLGAITRTTGTINFLLPVGAPSAVNGIRTTTGNTNGILGAWATVNGSDWATVVDGNIVAYTGYTDVTNFGSGAGAQGPVPDNGSGNIRIRNGGVSGSIALQDVDGDGVTNISTLLKTESGAATIGYGSSAFGKILRLGAVGGIMLAADAGSLTIGESADEGSVLTAGGATADTAGELLITNFSTTAAITVNADIQDNGSGMVSLVKNGPGLLVLTSTLSTYSGGTTINGGIVRISSDRSLGAVPGAADADNITMNGGTLQWAGNFINLNSNRGMLLLAGGGTLDTQAFSTSYSGIISGVGGLTKTGTGTLNLGGANTFEGEMFVSDGIVQIDHGGALGTTTGGTRVATNAILRLANGITVAGETLTINGGGSNNNGNLQLVAGTVDNVARGTWAGDIIIGNNAARVGTLNHGVLTLSGAIRNGSGNSISISASSTGGVVVFAGDNTYTGSTSIIRGTLRLGKNNSLPAGTGLAVHSTDATPDAATFDLAGFNQTIGGLSGVSRAAPTATNKTSVTNSSAEMATLTVNQNGNTEYFGEITGAINFVKSGAGTLTLENQTGALSNSYSGKTTISGGTLALRNAGNLDGTPWIQIDTGATLSITGRTGGAYTLSNKTLSGTGSVNGNLTLSGSSVIRPGATGAGGALADAGAGTGTLTFNNLTIAPVQAGVEARVYLQLGGTVSNFLDPLAGGDATYFSTASSEGLYDSLNVTGTLGLNEGSTIEVTLASGYTPGYGDVFNLMDWAILNANADGTGGAGNFTLADLHLPDISLGSGLFFNTDAFLSHGIIYVAPEPSRLLLLGAGLLSLLMRRRRPAPCQNDGSKNISVAMMRTTLLRNTVASGRRGPPSAAFTLIEMLVVMGVISLMLALAGLAAGGSLRAISLTNAGNKVSQLMEAARQRASSANVLTAVVLVSNLGVGEDGRAFTILERPPAGTWKQVREWEILPDGIVVDLSGGTLHASFLNHGPQPFPFTGADDAPVAYLNHGSLPAGTYAARIFLPGGGLLNPDDPAQLQLVEGAASGGTVAYTNINEAGKPSNFYRITLLGATGQTKVERP